MTRKQATENINDTDEGTVAPVDHGQIPPSFRFPDVGQWAGGELSRADEPLMTSPALDSQGPSRKGL